MIPVSTLSNSNQPKSSLCAAAEKCGVFLSFKCIPTAAIWFVADISLTHGHDSLGLETDNVWKCYSYQEAACILTFFVAHFFSSVMWRADNKLIKS